MNAEGHSGGAGNRHKRQWRCERRQPDRLSAKVVAQGAVPQQV